MVFKIIFSLESLMKYICTNLRYKDHCIFKYVIKFCIYIFCYNILDMYLKHVTLQKVNFKTYLHF